MSKWLFLIFISLWLIPQGIQASNIVKGHSQNENTWKKFNEAVDAKTDEIKQVVFGPVTKIIGVLGVAYGMIMTVMTAAPRPLIMYGGIGLLISIIPYFIDTVFGSVVPGM
jgi:hypothetical protein